MHENSTGPILILAYGNPARGDDGLGPAAAQDIEDTRIPGVTVATGCQLVLEDAELVSRHQFVLFLDAGRRAAEPFAIKEVVPADAVMFTTHALTPENILALSWSAFGQKPPAFQMAIRGYRFECGEGICARALENKRAAVSYIDRVIRTWKEPGCDKTSWKRK